MKLHAFTLSPVKHKAIDALLIHGDAEAARLCEISIQKLVRWKQEPLFDARLRAARRADFLHQKARLRHGAKGAVVSLVRIMYDARAKASDRLNAAKHIESMAEYAQEMEDLTADLTMEVAAGAARTEQVSLTAGESVKPLRTGHGAKYPRKKQEAITQLFKQRTTAAAARETGIGTQTLYQWMEEPEFAAECRAFEGSVFGEAMILARQKLGDAVSLIRNFSLDPDVPNATRIKAEAHITQAAKANAVEGLRARLSEEERARGSVVTEEPAEPAKVIGRDLRQRLRRLQALLPAIRYREFEYIHAVDGRATNSSVIGPQGFQVWSKPPEGSKVGERVPDPVAA